MSLFSLDFGGALFVILFRSLFPFVISIVYLSLCVCISASWKYGRQNRENNGTETKEGDYQIEKKMFNKNNRNKMEWFTFFSRKFTALKRWLVGRLVVFIYETYHDYFHCSIFEGFFLSAELHFYLEYIIYDSGLWRTEEKSLIHQNTNGSTKNIDDFLLLFFSVELMKSIKRHIKMAIKYEWPAKKET